MEKAQLQKLDPRLSDVSPDHFFHVCNGTVIRSLLNLEEALAEMGVETFAFHVREGNNDFVPWIRDCVGDELLAERIHHLTDKNAARIAILRRIIEIIEEH